MGRFKKLFGCPSKKRLFEACMNSREGAINILKSYIDKGGNINVRDSDGMTPLMWVCCGGVFNEEMLNLLIKSGADVNLKDFHNGLTALMYATMNNYLNIVKTLIKSGADVNCENDDGRTALSYSMNADSLDIVKILIKNGADINKKDSAGRTFLMDALKNSDLVKLLIEHGVDINICNNKGETALKIAIENNHKEAIRLLLGAGAK